MSMLFKFEGGQAQMFTMLFSNFPETIKKEVKDICINCSQNLILEKNAWENIQPLLDSCSIDCFLFWLDENYPATNRIISRIRQKKKYQHTPMLFFSFKIEYLLSAFVLWKSCEFFFCPLRNEKKEELAALIQHYDEMYQKIHIDSTFHCNISTSKEIFSIPYSDILFVESTMKKSVLHTKTGTHLLPVPLYRVRERLPASFFVQTHRSFIVNTKNIATIDKSKDPWVVTFFGSQKYAYISRNYKKEVPLMFPEMLDCQSN